MMAYRSTLRETNGWTPASIIFGKRLGLPSDLVFDYLVRGEFEVNDEAENLQQKLLVIDKESSKE